MPSRGSITLEDARIIHEFAIHMQPMLRDRDATKLCETAKTVVRIAYCAIAEARANARAERVRTIPPPGFIQDPYITEVIE